MSKALELKLINAGFEVTTSLDGKEALDRIEKEHFDLLLLDLVMPKTDGFAVLTALSARKSHPPVVVLSNLGQNEDQAKVKALGAVDYWVKADITLVEIVNRIKKLLDISE